MKAAILLGICIACYLAIAAEVHLASPDAADAFVPDSSMALSAAATASTFPVGVGESPPSDSLEQASDPTDNSRKCGPSAAVGSD